MIALDRRARAALTFVAFAACVTAFADVPGVAHDAGLAANAASRAPTVDATAHARGPVAVRRDPFVAPADEPQPSGATSDHPPRPIVPAGTAPAPLPPNAGALPQLPPNAGALPAANAGALAPLRAAADVRVAAVVTGRHAFALVVDGAETRLVGTGDRVGTTTVEAVSAAGIRLRDGSFIPVAPSAGRLVHGGP